MNNRDEQRIELSEAEGIKRLNDRIKELKKRNITPAVDDGEPTGLLSGGVSNLSLNEDSVEK